MTHQRFLSAVERSLAVAEPKRSDIIKELGAHLNDQPPDTDPVAEFGLPRSLAKRYDRAHLGRFGSGARLYLTPVAALFLFLPTRYLLAAVPEALLENDLVIFIYFARFVPAIIGAMLTGQALARLHRPLLPLLNLAVIVFLAANVVGLIGYRPQHGDDAGSLVVVNELVALVHVLAMAGIAAFAYRMERPWWGRKSIEAS